MGARGRPGLLGRLVWSPRSRGGGPGIPSRTESSGQLPDEAGTGLRRLAPTSARSAVGQRAGHIPRGAEEMAGIPPAAPRLGLGAGGWGGAGRAPEGPCAGAAGRWRGLPGLPDSRTGRDFSTGSASPTHRQHLGCSADSRSKLPGLLTCLWLRCSGSVVTCGAVLQPSCSGFRAASPWHTARDPSVERVGSVVRPLLVPAYAFRKPEPVVYLQTF